MRATALVPMLRAGALGTLAAIAIGFALDRGAPRILTAGACGVISALLALHLATRESGRNLRIEQIESESLELRRTLFHLRREARESSRPSAARPDDGAREACLANAVLSIATELNEVRVLESTARGILGITGASQVAIYPHDRRTDRFARGCVAQRTGSALSIVDSAPLAADDTAMRIALRRRRRIDDERSDPALSAAFDAAGSDLRSVLPMFDRAVACGVILVRGEIERGHLAALDGVAAAASLALTNARLRATALEGEVNALDPSRPSADPVNTRTTGHA